MSTLPHLPTLLRKTAARVSGSKPTSPKQQLSQTLPPVSQPILPPKSPKKEQPQIDEKTQAQLTEMQNVREFSNKRYDSLLSKIRNIDRNFNLNVKKIEQINFRAKARVTDRVSSISSEIEQLKTQKINVERKMQLILKNQEQTESSGFDTIMKPFKKNFDDFEEEYNKTSSTLNTLIQGLESKTASIVSRYNSYALIPKRISEAESKVNDLIHDSSSTRDIYDASVKEVEENIKHQSYYVNEKINEVKSNLENRIRILEKRIESGKTRTENSAGESEDSRFKLKKDFYEKVEHVMKNQQKKINELKSIVTDLSNSRFAQIEEIKARIKESFARLSEVRHTNLKEWSKSTAPKRTSLRPEIDMLKDKCEEYEAILRSKNIDLESANKEPKEDFKLLYRVLDDGSVKLAIRLPDNSVYFG